MTMATTQWKKGSASKPESALIDAYWRAANYLSVGQIYLFDNPLLHEPLKEEHVKPRLLGHWARRRASTSSTSTSTGSSRSTIST
jgi:xylulose-5-phosphate/fructose-6-phosphate phosphoketolase